MTIQPEYGEEKRMEQQSAGPIPPGHADRAGREGDEHAREEAEAEYLDPSGNEAHAPGETCERCGAVLTASQDARRLPDGHWVHEICPL